MIEKQTFFMKGLENTYNYIPLSWLYLYQAKILNF